MHSKSLHELPTMTYETSKCPDLLNFSQFHRYTCILKNRTMLFPTTFISVWEMIDVGLKKQVANF